MITFIVCTVILGLLLNALFVGLWIREVDEDSLAAYVYRRECSDRLFMGLFPSVVPYLTFFIGIAIYIHRYLDKIDKKWEAFVGVLLIAMVITFGIGIHTVL